MGDPPSPATGPTTFKMTPESDGPLPTRRRGGVGDFMSSPPGRITLLVAIAVLAFFGYRWLMTETPREANRVRHPGGYSIIEPSKWRPTIETNVQGDARDSLWLRPIQWKGLVPSIWVKRLVTAMKASDLQSAGFSSFTFQHQPAWVRNYNLKRYSTREVVFERGGDWFSAGASLADAEVVRMDDWWKFVETFQKN